MLEKEIVGFVDAAGLRILHRNHGARHCPPLDCLKDLRQCAIGYRFRIRIQAHHRIFTIRAVLALKRN
jgi:hypothetical protein